MSAPPQLRRRELAMTAERAVDFLATGYCGRLATINRDGSPYCVPLLYVWMDGEIYLHNARASSHLRSNVEGDDRVCFEVDEPGQVYAYGRFQCDASIAYRSVIVFGRIRIVADRHVTQRFFEALMAKYQPCELGQPKGFFPRLDQITCYAIAVERMTGKEIALPDPSQQWPRLDRTRTPDARLPDD